MIAVRLTWSGRAGPRNNIDSYNMKKIMRNDEMNDFVEAEEEKQYNSAKFFFCCTYPVDREYNY